MKQIIYILSLFFIFNCSQKVEFNVLQPAEISVKDIKNVAIGNFEIGLLRINEKIERNGTWKTEEVSLSEKEKKAISRQIRAQVVQQFNTIPYFKLSYTDEFAKLETDADFQKMIASAGFQAQNIDAVITGKIWLDIQRFDSTDAGVVSLEYQDSLVNLSMDRLVWFPYKGLRGSLILETKLTRLNPTEVVAVTVDHRTFAQKMEGKATLYESLESFSNILSSFGSSPSSKKKSTAYLTPLDEVISELAISIAAKFVERVAVTQKTVEYPIAKGGDFPATVLLQTGAFQLAIDRLLEVINEENNHEDIYNLALCYEGIGDYGIALITYEEAFSKDPTNLMYAQAIGRIEKIKRDHPRALKQLNEVKK